MDVLIESTKKFEDDLSKLSDKHHNQVVQIINQLAEDKEELAVLVKAKAGWPDNPKHKNHHHVSLITIGQKEPDPDNEWEQILSLYATKMDMGLTIILSIDEDPIFDQIILTFFTIVKTDEFLIAFMDISGLLLKDMRWGRKLLKDMGQQIIRENAQIS
ncbi:MAG TPA: hypothetical protein IGS52_12130 [Oscillatoriaceae cyanobacterium M33_DOE_052]|uniref:Uncharacterized protein n=1 Tax=Planktothricoides sp. SpSt-374 TaxID=2282167 RepID=A0A7C3VHB1_9CYAN|nr:hypothetical protein [Oscillatoriaceae cyanobacterium M33_DOE_052]